MGSGPHTLSLVDSNAIYPFVSLSLVLKTGGGTTIDALAGQGSFNFTASAGQYQTLISGVLTTSTPTLSTFGVTITPVPEPEIWAMMVVGMGLLGYRLRRRQRCVESS